MRSWLAVGLGGRLSVVVGDVHDPHDGLTGKRWQEARKLERTRYTRTTSARCVAFRES